MSASLRRELAELHAAHVALIRDMAQVIKERDAAEARGWQRATDALRDSQRRARYGADRAIMKIAADYLEAIANQATPDTPTPQAVRDDHS